MISYDIVNSDISIDYQVSGFEGPVTTRWAPAHSSTYRGEMTQVPHLFSAV